jgi:valine--pyruvate aminotransferase
MKLSRYGQRYSGQSDIIDLMQDLGSALRDNPQMLMMAGGTPARIPAAEQLFQHTLQLLLQDDDATFRLLGRYQGPKGDLAVRKLLAMQLREDHGWPLTADHIALTNGGQSAFGILANLLAGDSSEGRRRIHFPLVPEYLGYADVGLTADFFSGAKPLIQLLPDGLFKYGLDRSAAIPDATAALCVSRPTNPSGNVLTDDEVAFLDQSARARGIPLILDAAYGLPFPGLQYDDSKPYWSDNTILLLSLSKVGLPGTRSGFVIAKPELIEAFSRANTILNLAVGNLGPALALQLLQGRQLQRLAHDVLRPWYQAKATTAVAAIQHALQSSHNSSHSNVPCHIHRPEGAFFLWLWFPELAGSSAQLCHRLRQAGLLVIPGEASFIGLAEPWQHSQQCLRLSYAVADTTLEQGAAILGQVLQQSP